MVNSNVATITLAGNEIKVEFESGYPYYQITNKGDMDIYVSASPNITPEADGVYTVSAGGWEIIGEGYPFDKFYILGTGKAYIRGKQNAMPASFKRGGKGGDGNAELNILPHSEGLTYYFDYQKNITPSSWTDIISGYKIDSGIVQNTDYIECNRTTQLNWGVKKTFTVYCVCKCISDSDKNIGLFGTENNARDDWFMPAKTPKNTIGFVFNSPIPGYETAVSALDYHVLAWNFFDGVVFCYVDGKQVTSKTNCRTLDHWRIGNTAEDFLLCLKMIAFYENVAQGADSIAENSRYIAQKYGIEI
ncbi:MAG: hypothetical protein K2J73_08630 [Oscillospiraceae bacterium]|nr:hypothetical protein [Oscillospiraceae bacterium]